MHKWNCSTIHANVGKRIVISFSHSLNRPLFIHVQGLDYDVQTSDGSNVGYNKDSTTTHRITYTWYAAREGVFLFHDMGDSTGNEDGTAFREFALFVHDFAFLFDKEGKALNPPEVPGSHDEPGVMGINYRCEPMRERLQPPCDPAYIFSSVKHGDPATPILETYPVTR